MVKQEMTTEVCDRKIKRVRTFSGVVMVVLGAAAALLLGMDLWSPGNKHAMDAMRHLLTFMIQKQGRVDLTNSWRKLV